MKAECNVKGLEAVTGRIEHICDGILAGCVQGTRDGANFVLKDAKRLVPNATGRLKESLNARTKATGTGAQASINAETEYALYVEMGTGAASGKGKKDPAAAYTAGQTSVEAQPFLYPAYKMNQKSIVDAVAKAIQARIGG